jgi:hypothetical protein
MNPTFFRKYADLITEMEGIDQPGRSVNGKEVNVNSIEMDGIDPRDRPDFSDAYFSYAEFTDGTPLSDEELEQFQNENGDLVNEKAHEHFH